MSVREHRLKPHRERYPLEFDLEGVPRDSATRQQLLEQIRNPESTEMDTPQVQNRFLSDKKDQSPVNALIAALSPEQRANLLKELQKTQPVGRVIDLSKPIIVPYRIGDPKNDFPRLVYHHKNGKTLTVANDAELEAAKKDGFKLEPSPNHDYSLLQNGVAMTKAAAKRHRDRIAGKAKFAYESGMTAGEIAEVEAGEEG